MKIKDPFFYEQIRSYLQVYLPEQRMCSGKTVKSYREVISLFLDYLCGSLQMPLHNLGFTAITPDAIDGFLKWLEQTRGCKTSTINHHLAVVRAFLKYAGIRNPAYMDYYTKAQQIPFRKTEKRLSVNHFNEDTLNAILKEADPKKKTGHRDLFFMILLYDTGARDSEILDLHPADVIADKKAPYVYIRGKGKKIRTVPIIQKTVEHYHSYLKRFQVDPDDSENTLFFTVIHGIRQRMSDDNVARFLKKYADAARMKRQDVPERITPHMFRHSRALGLYRNGVPLPLISEWLGHSDLETTLIYAYADTEMKREAINKAMKSNHPLYMTETGPEDSEDDKLRQYYGLS